CCCRARGGRATSRSPAGIAPRTRSKSCSCRSCRAPASRSSTPPAGSCSSTGNSRGRGSDRTGNFSPLQSIHVEHSLNWRGIEMSRPITTLDLGHPHPAAPQQQDKSRYLVPLGRLFFVLIFLTTFSHFQPQTISYAVQQVVPLAT